MALIQGIISILPQLVTAAITLITALMGALINALPQLLSLWDSTDSSLN